MCEIAAIDPQKHSLEQMQTLSSTLYQQNSHGLGVVAVYRDDMGFGYRVWKSKEPEWARLTRFLDSMDDAWRIIIHARLATAGGKGYLETHPINVPCDDSNIKWVMHNGSVYNHRTLRSQLKEDGHEFRTEVDSEVIAHSHGEVPDSLDDDDFDEPELSGMLNYLLFSQDGILVRNTGKYQLNDELEMACSTRNITTPDETNAGYTLFHPDGSVETADATSDGYGETVIIGGRGVSGGWEDRGWQRDRPDGWYTEEPDEPRVADQDRRDNEPWWRQRGEREADSADDSSFLGDPEDVDWWYRSGDMAAEEWYCSLHDWFFEEGCPQCNGASWNKRGTPLPEQERPHR